MKRYNLVSGRLVHTVRIRKGPVGVFRPFRLWKMAGGLLYKPVVRGGKDSPYFFFTYSLLEKQIPSLFRVSRTISAWDE